MKRLSCTFGARVQALSAALLLGISAAATAEVLLPPALRGYLQTYEQPTVEGVTPRIIGGTQAASGAWPAQVALISAGASSNYNGLFCGGTVIDPLWVLTAAHCVSGKTTSSFQVLTGTNRLDGTGTKINVSQIIVHPSYNSSTFDNDIALVRLASSASVTAATLITSGTASLANSGVEAIATGWGDTNIDPNVATASMDLMQVTLPIVSNATCNNSYGGAITNNMLCAGYNEGGKDTCQGDSGGPLWVPNGSGGYVQAGITSFGNGCAQPTFYGVYARITQYNSWITSHVGTTPSNASPSVNAGSDQTVSSGASVTINVQATDADGSVVSVNVTQTAGPSVAANVTANGPSGALTGATVTFTAPTVTSNTTLTFTATATDDDGATGSDTVNITVLGTGGGSDDDSGGGGGALGGLGLALLFLTAARRRRLARR